MQATKGTKLGEAQKKERLLPKPCFTLLWFQNIIITEQHPIHGTKNINIS